MHVQSFVKQQELGEVFHLWLVIPLPILKWNGGYPVTVPIHYSPGNLLNHGKYTLTMSWLRDYHRQMYDRFEKQCVR